MVTLMPEWRAWELSPHGEQALRLSAVHTCGAWHAIDISVAVLEDARSPGDVVLAAAERMRCWRCKA